MRACLAGLVLCALAAWGCGGTSSRISACPTRAAPSPPEPLLALRLERLARQARAHAAFSRAVVAGIGSAMDEQTEAAAAHAQARMLAIAELAETSAAIVRATPSGGRRTPELDRFLCHLEVMAELTSTPTSTDGVELDDSALDQMRESARSLQARGTASGP